MSTKQPIKMDEESLKKRKHLSSPATSYLIIYNILQFVGWTTIMVLTVAHLMKKGTYIGLWDVTQMLLKIFQTAAVIEVVHAATGLVQSNPLLTLVQIFSRVMVVWGIAHSVKDAQDSVGIPLLLITWTITEMIRYSFYCLNLINMVPHFLIWCRYTFFILLYPSGVSGELFCMIAALPYIQRTGLYSVNLPNCFNFSFSFYYYVIGIMLSYIPVFPQLYFHMFAQRKKALNPKPKVKKSD